MRFLALLEVDGCTVARRPIRPGRTTNAAWQVTTDSEQIRKWVEEYETVPVLAEKTSGAGLRLFSNSDDDRGEQLSLDRFFERLDSHL